MSDSQPPESPPQNRIDPKPWRALIAYWILGLCNNYGYVVMLVAANDIIGHHEEKKKNVERNCSYMSTGAILLADILPSLFVKFLAPFFPLFIKLRISITIILSTTGYILVALSNNIALSLFGVVTTSFSAGLGEISYLTYSSFYDKNVVSTWSSGTGGAGVVGALSYTILREIGFKTALLVMLLVPFTTFVAFFFLLPKPLVDETKLHIQRGVNAEEVRDPKLALLKKFKQTPPMVKYMVPLGLVYFLEYFINQATFELINFRNVFLTPEQQYRWLQVDYQVGVFISRSSVNLVQFKKIWLMSIFQAINVAIFTTEVIYYYMPNFWIVVALTFWEGLLGGAAYVNTFYRISSEVEEEKKQFSMAVTGFADGTGITIAGIVAIYAHNAICSLPPPKRRN